MTKFQRKTHRVRRILEAVAHIYPTAWAQIDDLRSQRGPGFDWPDWCYMPIAGGIAVASAGGQPTLDDFARAPIITALATWRMTQGIYRFDPALRDAVVDTPLDGDLPVDHLYRLPEWCVYVETDGSTIQYAGRPLHGFWAHLEYDFARGGAPELRFVLDCATDPRQPFGDQGLETLPMILTGATLLDALAKVQVSGLRMAGLPIDSALGRAATQVNVVQPLVSMLLYLCADTDVTRRGHAGRPANPRPVRSKAGWTIHPASGPAEWDVGVRIGAALRAAYQREETGKDAAPTGRQVRPHVRRAHWHTILSGPRKDVAPDQRQHDLRWMPPIPVNVDDLDRMPAVIKKVKQ